jgi:hypothetical protein
MLNKALDSDLIIKNVAKQINTLLQKRIKGQTCINESYALCNGMMLIFKIRLYMWYILFAILEKMGSIHLRCTILKLIMASE